MKIDRVINIEDTSSKHMAVRRSLNKCGITDIDHATTALEGLAMIDAAIEEGNPYSLLVLDMYFPIFPGERMTQAGLYVMEELKIRQLDIPIIICSSVRLNIPEVVGCIYYNEFRGDLDEDMKTLIQKLTN